MCTTAQFLEARDHLLRLREDLTAAQRDFRWPELEQFNWVGDYFDVIAAGNDAPALRLVDDTGGDLTLSFMHEAVLEAAVVPSPDPVRLAVPKAFVTLAAGRAPDATTAASILTHVRDRVSPYKRVRRLEFALLPKTISGKIRRAELRKSEERRLPGEPRRTGEFWEEDLRARACQPD